MKDRKITGTEVGTRLSVHLELSNGKRKSGIQYIRRNRDKFTDSAFRLAEAMIAENDKRKVAGR